MSRNGNSYHRINNRASGLSRLTNFKNFFRRKYGGGVNLSLNEYIDVKTSHHKGNTTCLDLDTVEGRYLLSGAVDGHVSIYDLSVVDSNNSKSSYGDSHGSSIKNIAPLVFSKKSLTNPLPAPHKHMMSTVQWYPVDTGIFISSCMGGTMNVWDTNNMKVVSKFQIGRRINASSMSRVSKHHSLVAVGCDENTIRLCDLRTGSQTHLLQGHREEVLSLAWSPVDEYVIASGSNDRSARLWDVRSSGLKACTYIYDMYDTKGTRKLKNKNNEIADAAASSSIHQQVEHVKYNNNNGSSTNTAAAKKRPRFYQINNSYTNNNRNKKKRRNYDVLNKNFVTSHSSGVKSIEFTPDGLFLATCSSNNITLWDAYEGTNQLIHYPNYKAAYCGNTSPLKILQTGSSYDAQIIAPIDKSGDIVLYNMHAGTISSRLKGHYETVTDVVVRDVGSNIHLFSSSLDGNILAWN